VQLNIKQSKKIEIKKMYKKANKQASNKKMQFKEKMCMTQ